MRKDLRVKAIYKNKFSDEVKVTAKAKSTKAITKKDTESSDVSDKKEEKSVKESIYLILMTRRTERLTRPFFGSNIDSYAFMVFMPAEQAGQSQYSTPLAFSSSACALIIEASSSPK